jgi:uncharacterized SAM-binding protein YcdF (DUF218 family)
MFLHNFSHFMQIWLFPPGLILILMLIGFILYWSKSAFGKKLIGFSYVLFWLLSMPLLAQFLIDTLQTKYNPVLLGTPIDTNATAIVVLGSGVEKADEYLKKDVASEKTMQRTNYAAFLSKHTQLPIITSGGNRDNVARSEAVVMREMLEDNYDIKVKATETDSHTTEEQAHLLVPILTANSIHTIYLVTNAWHMPRSVLAFQNAFAGQNFIIVPAPMGYINLKADSFLINLLPSINALKTSAYAMHEYTGLIWYHLRGTGKSV